MNDKISDFLPDMVKVISEVLNIIQSNSSARSHKCKYGDLDINKFDGHTSVSLRYKGFNDTLFTIQEESPPVYGIVEAKYEHRIIIRRPYAYISSPLTTFLSNTINNENSKDNTDISEELTDELLFQYSTLYEDLTVDILNLDSKIKHLIPENSYVSIPLDNAKKHLYKHAARCLPR